MYFKHFKIGVHEKCAFLIIVFALVLRIILIAQSWPQTNSDEGTLGLMTLHIAYRGEHPIFFYGQGYMGSFEAYLAAILFQLFGSSLFMLRFGLVLLFALFLVSIYLLTNLLYTKNLALATLCLLSLGSEGILYIELRAIGGYAEILLCSTLLLLLATWLSLSLPLSGIGFGEHHRGSRRGGGRAVGWWGPLWPPAVPVWSFTSGRPQGPPPLPTPLPPLRDAPPSQGAINRAPTRYALYACWGLLAGFGVWTDLLVLPFVLVSGLLLVVFCWREWRTWAPLCLMLGFSIGILPSIIYNLTTPSNEGTLYFFFRIYSSQVAGKAVVSHILFSQKVLGTLLVGIPNATGANPICPNHNLPFFGLFSSDSLQCTLLQGSWSLGALTLWTIAVALTIKTLWTHLRHQEHSKAGGRGQAIAPTMDALGRLIDRKHSRGDGLSSPCSPTLSSPWGVEMRQTTVRYVARLMLLSGAALTVLLFALSPVSALDPWTNSRYLFCLLIATPAVIAPLWKNEGGIHLLSTWRGKLLAAVKVIPLLYISVMLVVGTMNVYKLVPQAQAFNQQEDQLISNLLQVGATHIYSEYWTCDRIVFLSDERIICGVVNDDLKPGYNRYQPYYALVTKDSHASYVFPLGSPEAFNFEQKIAHTGQHFQRFVFDGYVVYKPV